MKWFFKLYMFYYLFYFLNFIRVLKLNRNIFIRIFQKRDAHIYYLVIISFLESAYANLLLCYSFLEMRIKLYRARK